jgi:hypothetical protein
MTAMLVAVTAVPLLLGGVLWSMAALERWLDATEEEDTP